VLEPPSAAILLPRWVATDADRPGRAVRAPPLRMDGKVPSSRYTEPQAEAYATGEGPPMEQPIVNIVGEKVALGPMHRDLLPLVMRWSNDFAAQRNIGAPRPRTLDQRIAQYERDTVDEQSVDFAVYERAILPGGHPRPIGTVGLFDINYRNGRAEFGIFIGEADARGKGYGTETTLLMLDYAFTALGLRNVALTVAEWNVAGQRAYTKAGFREFGRRRACWPMAGRWWDEVHMDALASEFVSPVLAHIFTPDVPRREGDAS
ncbi:MAG: GNAT family N-acetyltransferase, partial [Thermomicrobiales bacterium]